MSTIDVPNMTQFNAFKDAYGLVYVNSMNGGDLNSIKNTCNLFVFNCANSPVTEGAYGFLQSFNLAAGGFVPSNKGVVVYIFISYYDNRLFIRKYAQEQWEDWIEFSKFTHTHDDRYYTKAEIDNMLNNR